VVETDGEIDDTDDNSFFAKDRYLPDDYEPEPACLVFGSGNRRRDVGDRDGDGEADGCNVLSMMACRN